MGSTVSIDSSEVPIYYQLPCLYYRYASVTMEDEKHVSFDVLIGRDAFRPL